MQERADDYGHACVRKPRSLVLQYVRSQNRHALFGPPYDPSRESRAKFDKRIKAAFEAHQGHVSGGDRDDLARLQWRMLDEAEERRSKRRKI